MKPILKWAGGKSALLNEIQKRMPKNFETYFEPFVGGGAVFFGTDIKHSVINDINVELINCYKQVRDHCDELIPLLDDLQKKHSEEKYYELRSKFNLRKAADPKNLNVYDAALMLYLNKAGFNGMYRENRKGYFNIPSGHKKNVTLYERDNLLAVSEKLKTAKILNEDFEESVKTAKEGDFVYFDSPYDETFSDYQKGGFSKEEHKRLADLCHRLDNQNINFLLSSSDSEFIHDLYKDFKFSRVQVTRMIRFRGNRTETTELFIYNYPLNEQ
ncbi:DNA adenine methylase [Absicoccus porci]|uniref:DNA adenine methylase n=1 Tax=Absicoccus porci TaxID=2486576 RepID=UPI002A81EECC|nr:DNA adenine methylase [Absicoccus porci]MDY4739647.1 DNA adenine methylase [Absicoccus porci]